MRASVEERAPGQSRVLQLDNLSQAIVLLAELGRKHTYCTCDHNGEDQDHAKQRLHHLPHIYPITRITHYAPLQPVLQITTLDTIFARKVH